MQGRPKINFNCWIYIYGCIKYSVDVKYMISSKITYPDVSVHGSPILVIFSVLHNSFKLNHKLSTIYDMKSV